MFAPEEELDAVLEQVTRLHTLGINTVPVCRPSLADWCSASWHPTPCEERGKRPLVAGYPARAHRLLELGTLVIEFEGHWPCGLGMVVPVGCVVVEADSPDAEAELLALGGPVMDSAPARERRTGRGRGWIFRVDPALNLTPATRLGTSEAIDVLTAGSLFVLPPSVHRTMHTFAWVLGRAPWEVTIPLLPQPILGLAQARARARRGSEALVVSCGSFEPHVTPRVRFLLDSRRALRRLWEGEKDRGDSSASGVDFALARELLAAGVTPDEAASAIAARPAVHRADANYAIRTVAAARRRKR